MARTRRTRPELTESWADVDDTYGDDGEHIYSEEDEREEVGSQYQPETRTRAPRRSSTRANGDTSSTALQDTVYVPRRRPVRSSFEPELVMPSSPDAGAVRKRDATPRFRINERSNTSDAGQFRRETRAVTPRVRLAERSMTSDAGKFTKGSRLAQHDEADYESDEEQPRRKGNLQFPATIWRRLISPLLGYATDVVGHALHHLKPLLGYALLAYILGAALVFGAGFLSNSVNRALSPICRLPFTSNLAFCPSSINPELQGQAEFSSLIQAQDAFQDVLAGAEVGVNLPLDMKRTETSIRDLRHVVQHSHLPSRHELVFEFGGFIDTARQASTDLSRFNSRIGRAVDSILSTNKWTLSVIDGVSEQEAARGAIVKFFNNNLNLFAPFQPLSVSREVLLDQYLRHTTAVEEQILLLIDEALALREILDNLDGRLEIIADIATRDGVRLDTNKEELFATLWTKLGGNRDSVNKLNKQLGLLRDVVTYRRAAWAHVAVTLEKLQSIQHSLEDLRERVALPETVGSKIPLEIHIENINLGIERLERQRDQSRQVEKEKYAKIVGKAETGDKKVIGDEES